MVVASSPVVLPSTRAAFGLCIIAVTGLAFLAGGLQWIAGPTSLFPLQRVIGVLALIHVPMTIYLLGDPAIRTLIARRPIALVGVPLLIFAGCFAAFYLSHDAVKQGQASGLVLFQYLAIAWNFWHFGKQNVGVYSFFRQARDLPGMSLVERRLIVAGASLGALAVFTVGNGIVQQYAPRADLGWLLAVGRHVSTWGTVAQVALAGLTLVVLWQGRARHTGQSAVLLFLSVNFFLPTYAVAESLPLTFVFACGSLAHGLQYLVFLGFHAGFSGHWNRKRWVLPVAFVACGLVLTDLYAWNLGLSFGGAGRLFEGLSDASGSAIANGLLFGILLNHFWLDSHFWHFRDPETRDWMRSRFAFVFAR